MISQLFFLFYEFLTNLTPLTSGRYVKFDKLIKQKKAVNLLLGYPRFIFLRRQLTCFFVCHFLFECRNLFSEAPRFAPVKDEETSDDDETDTEEGREDGEGRVDLLL